MTKGLLGKIIGVNDLGASFANAGAVYASAYAVDLAINYFLGVNPNRYNSIVHITTGTLIGTYAFRRINNFVRERTGSKLKGILAGIGAGFIAGGVASLSWEYIESERGVFSIKELPVDVLFDHLAVGIGVAVSPLIEWIKPYIKKL